jgi:4-carboxymuconolactone decarboxylase
MVTMCKEGVNMKLIIIMLSTMFSTTVALSTEKNMTNPKRELGIKTLNEVTKGDGQKVIDSLKDFPVLSDGIIEFAYGDVISRKVLDPKSRQLATVAALAAQGMLGPQLKVHYAGALNVGVKPEELVEIVYLTSVYAGMPKAINAASVLTEVFKERGIK